MAKYIYAEEAAPSQVGVGELAIPGHEMLDCEILAPTDQGSFPTAAAPAVAPMLDIPQVVAAAASTLLGAAAAQVQSLLRAALRGTPFCEQCSKMK